MTRALRSILLGLIALGLLTGTPAFALTLHLCHTEEEVTLNVCERCDHDAEPAISCCDAEVASTEGLSLSAAECCRSLTVEKDDVSGVIVETSRTLAPTLLPLPAIPTALSLALVASAPVDASICDRPPPRADAGRHRYLRLAHLLI